MACARLAEDRGQPGAAAELLERVRAPAERPVGGGPHFEAARLRALSLAGREADAEQVCSDARAKFPQNDMLAERFIAPATRRGDFADAVARAEQMRPHFPDSDALPRLTEWLRALSGNAQAPSAENAAPTQDGLATFFLQLESPDPRRSTSDESRLANLPPG